MVEGWVGVGGRGAREIRAGTPVAVMAHSDPTMRILTWNLRHGGGARVPAQLVAIAGHAPEIVVLTEYRTGPAGERLTRGLDALGFVHQAVPPTLPPRRNAVLVAARRPFEVIPHPLLPAEDAPRLIHARFDGLDVLGVYFALGLRKQPLFEYLVGLDTTVLAPGSVLIGDFNTGKHRVDELGATFVLSECLDALERRGWVDAWRLRNGDTRVSSWFSSAGNGFRIDHAFVTSALVARLVDARYSDAERAAGLSDHAALVVDLGAVG
jgi:exodeoxyribonuclease-3